MKKCYLYPKKIFFMLLTFLLIFTSVFQASPEHISRAAKTQSGFEYHVADDHVVIDKYIGKSKKPSIPKTIAGKKVTEIGPFAFLDVKQLVELKLPGTITAIGDSAFKGCTSLKTITIPNTITVIPNEIFRDCESLEKVILPDSITSIGYGAFMGCSALKSISVPSKVTTIGNSTFQNCKNLKNINIPDTVTKIGKYAFFDCSSLRNLTLPKYLTELEERSFSECDSLRSITLSDFLTTIGNFAFSGCESLTGIHIPKNVKKIGERILNDCVNLERITVDSGNYMYNSHNDCNAIIWTPVRQLIAGCKNTVIPEDITRISSYAFYGHTGLKRITIPAQVNDIGRYVFYGCSSLASVSVDSNNKTYDSRNNCNAIIHTATDTLIAGCKSTVIPQNIKTIGIKAFGGCTLTELFIPASVTVFEEAVFSECQKLKNIYYAGTSKEWNSIARALGNDNLAQMKVSYNCKGFASVTLSKTSMKYTGKELKPTVTVKDRNGKTISKSNYTVKYTNNIKVGTATVTVTMKGSCKGTVKKTFRIVK